MATKSLRKKIVYLRKQSSMNRRDFSRETGLSYHTILAIELGRTAVPQIDTLVRIAKGLAMTVDELLAGTEFDI